MGGVADLSQWLAGVLDLPFVGISAVLEGSEHLGVDLGVISLGTATIV